MVGGRPVMEAPPPMEEEVECTSLSLSFLHCLCIGLFGIFFCLYHYHCHFGAMSSLLTQVEYNSGLEGGGGGGRKKISFFANFLQDQIIV